MYDEQTPWSEAELCIMYIIHLNEALLSINISYYHGNYGNYGNHNGSYGNYGNYGNNFIQIVHLGDRCKNWGVRAHNDQKCLKVLPTESVSVRSSGL